MFDSQESTVFVYYFVNDLIFLTWAPTGNGHKCPVLLEIRNRLIKFIRNSVNKNNIQRKIVITDVQAN